MFGGINLRAVLQEVLMNLIHNMCSEITLLKLLPYLPGGNELISFPHPCPSILAQHLIQSGSITAFVYFFPKHSQMIPQISSKRWSRCKHSLSVKNLANVLPISAVIPHKILCYVRQCYNGTCLYLLPIRAITYPCFTYALPRFLMIWYHKKPGHQQAWCCGSLPSILSS